MAVLVVHAVRDQGRSLDDALAELDDLDDPRDHPLVRELCYGVLRTLPRQEALAGALLHRPLKRADRELEALILVGLDQLTDTHIPPYAVIAATVDAARTIRPGRRGWSCPTPPLSARTLLDPPDPTSEVRWLLPRWLLEQKRTAWPQHWRKIITASNARPPMTLRVNRLRITRAHYARQISNPGLTAHPSPGTTYGLTLDRPVPTVELPSFTDSLVSVQGAGAQLTAKLLDTQPGERILNACVAPGGKSAHILEHARRNLDLTALDMIRLASSKCGPTCADSPSRPELPGEMPRPLVAPGLKQATIVSSWMHPALLPGSSAATRISNDSAGGAIFRH